jgi:(p)ppGpp synthase/HD superfamily hydrolase
VELDGPFASRRDKTNACCAALNVYAVLAERAGMGLIKNAIEDRAFQYLMPEEYARIAEALETRRKLDEDVLRQARSELLQMLREDAVFQQAVTRYEVKGRVKQPYR